MGGGISKMAKQELLATIRDRYRASSKREKSRILDEFIAVTGHHRKHGIRLLGQSGDDGEQQPAVKRSRRIYDDAVGEALIVVWEAADRICGKRLKAALPHLVESMERHGHLDLDPRVRQRLLTASAATLDRLLQPIRTPAARRLRRRRQQSLGRNIPVRTFADWNAPPPGFLEIDLVVHHGGPLWGSMIHSLGATEALLLARTGEQPGPTDLTSDGLDDLVSADPAAASLQGRYYSRLSQLHGACFYTGACNRHTERRIREAGAYIDDAVGLAGEVA